MATNLVVRNVDEEVALVLRQRAAQHGRSAEAEHREILKSALTRPKRKSARTTFARLHGLTVATRNEANFAGTGIELRNPFAE
jgi:plasmid stability protein